jgi:CheY-like chemotaxis protein
MSDAGNDPGNAGARVLLVDDNVAMRRVLRGLLEDEDLPVVGEASDGRTALRMVETLKPNVVLMDQRMPVMDGATAVRELRASHPKVQIVMHSLMEGLEEELRDAGVFAVVPKGKGAHLLCATIAEAARASGVVTRPPADQV